MALHVAEKSRTGPVYGKCPTLGRCRSCEAERADTEERVQEEKEQDERRHATGLGSGTKKLILGTCATGIHGRDKQWQLKLTSRASINPFFNLSQASTTRYQRTLANIKKVQSRSVSLFSWF